MKAKLYQPNLKRYLSGWKAGTWDGGDREGIGWELPDVDEG